MTGKNQILLTVGTVLSALLAYFLVSFWGAMAEQEGQGATSGSAKIIFTVLMTAVSFFLIRLSILSHKE